MIGKSFVLGLTLTTLGLLSTATAVSAAEDAVILAGCCPAGGCSVACCPIGCCSKTCHAVVEPKTVTTKVYGEACEEFCLPKISCFKHCFEQCEPCGTGPECGKVHTKRCLVIKVRRTEECETKCVVDQCSPATVPAIQPLPTQPLPTTVPAPAPKKEPILYEPMPR